MADLPIILTVRGLRCVVVGGGAVALRRTRTLLDAGAQVTVIAPAIDPALAELPVTLIHRPYQAGDLASARLAVIATDDPAVNAAAADEARRRGVLVNRPDAPEQGDFAIPALARLGPLTLAVDTAGVSASAAAAIRDELAAALDPDWPRLLELARPYRAAIRERFPDPAQRRNRLAKLTEPAAMAILKAQGDEALRRHLDALCQPA